MRLTLFVVVLVVCYSSSLAGLLCKLAHNYVAFSFLVYTTIWIRFCETPCEADPCLFVCL